MPPVPSNLLSAPSFSEIWTLEEHDADLWVSVDWRASSWLSGSSSAILTYSHFRIFATSFGGMSENPCPREKPVADLLAMIESPEWPVTDVSSEATTLHGSPLLKLKSVWLSPNSIAISWCCAIPHSFHPPLVRLTARIFLDLSDTSKIQSAWPTLLSSSSLISPLSLPF